MKSISRRWCSITASRRPSPSRSSAYLNAPFFLARWVVYLVVWGWSAVWFSRRSLAQDASGDAGETLRMERRSAPVMLAFALTVTFASFDLLMSLDAHWYSTIYGVYYFAGGVVGFFALLTLLACGVQRAGFLRHAVTVEHYHDLGKLLFAFVVFWAYIGFSQLMLIWYANIPEETGWYLRRQTGGWGWVGLVLLLGHFLLPFVALLSRAPKGRPRFMALAAAWMLLMHWVDLSWLVLPEASPDDMSYHAMDVLLSLGLGAVALAVATFQLRDRSLIPAGDPRLDESRCCVSTSSSTGRCWEVSLARRGRRWWS